MPIYEYACRSCEHRFETIQKTAEDPLSECPECSRPTLKKLLSAPVFRLKGGGWYETDFKTGDKRNIVETGNGKAEAGNSDASADSPKANGEDGQPKSAAANEKAPTGDGKSKTAGGDKAKTTGDGSATGSAAKAPRPKGGDN